jgi:hypothetical protein
VTSLAGAGSQAFGDVEAVSLLDDTVAGVAQVANGRYALCVAPGPYALVSRAERLPAGRNVESTIAVTASKPPKGVDLALFVVSQFVLASPAAAAGGGVIAMSRIPLIYPDDFNMAPNASASGGLDYGFIDPCKKAGKTIVAADPTVLDFIKQEHARADAGRSTPMGPLNIPTPDTVIDGKVTVGEDGKPVADITITDVATGAVIDHIVVAGDPGQFPRTGDGDPSGFLRQVGQGLAARDCKKIEPPTTQAPVTQGPDTVLVRYTGSFQADYTNAGYSYHTHFSWDETERFTPNAQGSSWVPTAGQLTASGIATASGTQGGPDDNCTYSAAPNPKLKIVINYAGQNASSNRAINVGAQMPIDTNAQGRNDSQLSYSGTCTTTSSVGVNPYLHQNPLGGTYDPGAHLQAALAGEADNIVLDQLTKQPLTMQFPVDYTQQDRVGGTEHVVVTAALTVAYG